MIQFRSVGKTYDNKTFGKVRPVEALRDISFTVETGEFVVIRGRSGSGKTTLLQLLGGLTFPTSGDIFIDGENSALLTDDALSHYRSQKVGFIFQDFNLLNHLTVWENILLPVLFSSEKHGQEEERARVLLERVGLLEKKNDYPVYLSGGQKQRVAIARALLLNPTLILADEPTGNLDAETGAEIERLLFELCREFKVTVFLVTHDDHMAERADRLLVVEDGQIGENTLLQSA
jgi:putative ABC transport system ATP-binding protein